MEGTLDRLDSQQGKMQNFSKNILRFAEKTLAIYGILWYHTSWLRTAGVERAFGTSHDMR